MVLILVKDRCGRLASGILLALLVLVILPRSLSPPVGRQSSHEQWQTKTTDRGNNGTTIFSLAPGELPGYTGWPRPEFTFAGHFVPTYDDSAVRTGAPWTVTLTCTDEPCATATTWFYARAYGPSVLVGHVHRADPGVYVVTFVPFDAGAYTVEVVTTISRVPALETFPLSPSPPPLYEGYLVQGFPLQLQVTGSSAKPRHELQRCQAEQLVESTNSGLPIVRARWKVTDQTRAVGHPQRLPNMHVVNGLAAYQHGVSSVGVSMDYEYATCRLMDEPRHNFQPYRCVGDEQVLHFVLIGDSVMRLQKEWLDQHVQDQANIKVSFLELYGGYRKCEHSGPSVEDFLRNIEASDRPEKRIIVFNTGLHDIHRLCGSDWVDDRKEYRINPDESCITAYHGIVQDFAKLVNQTTATAKIFQTTTAAWPKYGNFGVNWAPTAGQPLPLDAGFVQHFNAIAMQELQPFGKIQIVDGYWITLARPDHREIDRQAKIGKKLSHPGIEVIQILVRVWSMLALYQACA